MCVTLSSAVFEVSQASVTASSGDTTRWYGYLRFSTFIWFNSHSNIRMCMRMYISLVYINTDLQATWSMCIKCTPKLGSVTS